MASFFPVEPLPRSYATVAEDAAIREYEAAKIRCEEVSRMTDRELADELMNPRKNPDSALIIEAATRLRQRDGR